jgi:peptidyl-dipeptidase A
MKINPSEDPRRAASVRRRFSSLAALAVRAPSPRRPPQAHRRGGPPSSWRRSRRASWSSRSRPGARPGCRPTSSPRTPSSWRPTAPRSAHRGGGPLATEAARFDGLELPEDLRRQIGPLEAGAHLPAPNDPEKTAELRRSRPPSRALYGSGKYCPEGGLGVQAALPASCRGRPLLDRGALEGDRAERGPGVLLEVWTGWRTISPAHARRVRALRRAQRGRPGLGFADTGALWRSGTTCPRTTSPGSSTASGARCGRSTTRSTATCAAGSRRSTARWCRPQGMIPAHLVGNMWAQSWLNVYDLTRPRPNADPGYDLTELLEAKGLDARRW